MSLPDSSSQNNPWAQRSDVFKALPNRSFADLLEIIDGTYRVYSKLCETIGPWNAKQAGAQFPYSPPTREFIITMLKNKPRVLSEFLYNTMINSAIRFCEQYKGKHQLIAPHPSSHHSAHFPEGTFKIKKISDNLPQLAKTHNTHFKASNLGEITLEGVEHPLYIENIKSYTFRYVIVRPKLGKLGTANSETWEALLYTKNFGFNLEHCDSNSNPRYSGIL